MALSKTRWRRTRLCSAQRSSAPAGGTASRAGRAARLCGPPPRGGRRSALLAPAPAPARRPHQSRHSPRRCSSVRDLAARLLLARRPFSISRMQPLETCQQRLGWQTFPFRVMAYQGREAGHADVHESCTTYGPTPCSNNCLVWSTKLCSLTCVQAQPTHRWTCCRRCPASCTFPPRASRRSPASRSWCARLNINKTIQWFAFRACLLPPPCCPLAASSLISSLCGGASSLHLPANGRLKDVSARSECKFKLDTVCLLWLHLVKDSGT